jgi:hypothetical protein
MAIILRIGEGEISIRAGAAVKPRIVGDDGVTSAGAHFVKGLFGMAQLRRL